MPGARRRSRAASRGRRWCACGGAAPRAACRCSSNHASRSASSASMPSIARCMLLLVGDVVRRREQHEPVELLDDLAGERVDRARCARPRRRRAEMRTRPLLVGGEHLDRVAPHPELVAGEAEVVALVLELDEPARGSRAGRAPPPRRAIRQLLRVHLGRAEAVDRRDRGDDDDVPPRHERARGRVAEPVDLVVDRRVLLDVGVGRREVRLGLVVVVVGDEVLDPVLREELAELAGELRGEALVGREHERRPLDLRDHAGDRERLPRAGDAEQRLEPVAPLDAGRERRRSPRAGRRRP